MDYKRRQVVTTRVEFVLPTPALWTDVDKALVRVLNEYKTATGKSVDALVADDAVKVWHGDDEIVFSYETSKVTT